MLISWVFFLMVAVFVFAVFKDVSCLWGVVESLNVWFYFVVYWISIHRVLTVLLCFDGYGTRKYSGVSIFFLDWVSMFGSKIQQCWPWNILYLSHVFVFICKCNFAGMRCALSTIIYGVNVINMFISLLIVCTYSEILLECSFREY